MNSSKEINNNGNQNKENLSLSSLNKEKNSNPKEEEEEKLKIEINDKVRLFETEEHLPERAQEKIIFFDYLSLIRAIACLMAVLIHTNNFWYFRKTLEWDITNFLESFLMPCVPFFFMISGITLIDYSKRYSTKEFIKKRIIKIFIPYYFWTIMSALVHYFFQREYYPKDYFTFWKVFNRIINGEEQVIYWFFRELFKIYAILPIITYIPDNLKQNVFIYCLITCFLLNQLIPFIIYLPAIPDLKWEYHTVIGNTFSIYIFIGYLLHTNEINKKYRICSYILGIIGLVSQFLGVKYLSINQIDWRFKGAHNVPSFVQSVGLFIFLKYNYKEIEVVIRKPFVKLIDRHSFSIYLLHHFFLGIYKGFHSIAYTFISWVIIIIICILISFIIKKIPYIKNVLP